MLPINASDSGGSYKFTVPKMIAVQAWVAVSQLSSSSPPPAPSILPSAIVPTPVQKAAEELGNNNCSVHVIFGFCFHAVLFIFSHIYFLQATHPHTQRFVMLHVPHMHSCFAVTLYSAVSVNVLVSCVCRTASSTGTASSTAATGAARRHFRHGL